MELCASGGCWHGGGRLGCRNGGGRFGRWCGGGLRGRWCGGGRGGRRGGGWLLGCWGGCPTTGRNDQRQGDQQRESESEFHDLLLLWMTIQRLASNTGAVCRTILLYYGLRDL